MPPFICLIGENLKNPSFAQFPALPDAPARKVLPDSIFDPQDAQSIPGGERLRLFAEDR
jgi:hypothetical protein